MLENLLVSERSNLLLDILDKSASSKFANSIFLDAFLPILEFYCKWLKMYGWLPFLYKRFVDKDVPKYYPEL